MAVRTTATGAAGAVLRAGALGIPVDTETGIGNDAVKETGALGVFDSLGQLGPRGFEQLATHPLETGAAIGGLAVGIVTLNPVAIGAAGAKLAQGTLATYQQAEADNAGGNYFARHGGFATGTAADAKAGPDPVLVAPIVDTAPVKTATTDAASTAAEAAAPEAHPRWHHFLAWLKGFFS